MLRQVIRSHIKPYKLYSKDNKCIGTYVIHMPDVFTGFNIELIPLPGTRIENAVKESIELSNRYQLSVWMNWFQIRIDIPYKTNSDEKTINDIVDKYLKTFEHRAKTNRCVGG